ncbi:MAG: restriction endonuclease [Candidatus Symbiopectobacterium sp. Dall1.0]|nr:restriction endonuclease [Candidatus Symbiopectobacterium sp. Dall1.0]
MFEEQLISLSEKIRKQEELVKTEEATKTAFIMPFINSILGYDIFNPSEVIPEFICDVGTKKGEKIDYAILKDGEIKILIECKKIGDDLNIKHASQLFRYFHATSARIGILTNGRFYNIFTDLDAPNKMDEKPFLELDIANMDECLIPELLKLTKDSFNVDSIVNAAGELKYISQIKKILNSIFTNPDEYFIKYIASNVYDVAITQKVRELFSDLTKKASSQFINDKINDRLKMVMTRHEEVDVKLDDNKKTDEFDNESEIVTTQDEISGYLIVKAILCGIVDVSRVYMRDMQTYCGIIMDDNNRKPICRLHFNRKQKYIGLFDKEKKENKLPIKNIDDLYQHKDSIIETARQYL